MKRDSGRPWRHRFLRALHAGRREVQRVAIEPAALVAPADCACCGAMAAKVTRESGRDGSALVPYCSDCHYHASAQWTKTFATTLSSAMVGITLAASLPLILQPTGLEYFMAVAFGSAVPVLVSVAWRRRPRQGCTAAGRAVWWAPEGLTCTRAEFAEQVGRLAGVEPQPYLASEPRFSRWMLTGILAASATVPFFFYVHFPPLRVLNLTDRQLTVFVDDSRWLSLAPARSESPTAGHETRLAAGGRRLRAMSSGQVVDERRVELRSGMVHLYAPASDDRCFWLEIADYGRSGEKPGMRIELLPLGQGFWRLERPVDIWFSPSPTVSEDTRSTGGRLVALRHELCSDAPATVRRAAHRAGWFATHAE